MEEGRCRKFPGLPVPPALLGSLCLFVAPGGTGAHGRGGGTGGLFDGQ